VSVIAPVCRPAPEAYPHRTEWLGACAALPSAKAKGNRPSAAERLAPVASPEATSVALCAGNKASEARTGRHCKAYAFSRADLRSSLIPPSLPGATPIAVSWSLGAVRASRVTQGIVVPPPSPPTVRLWDPVRFVAENTLTGEQTRGEIFSMMLDVDGEGEARFTPAVGLWIDATEATFEMSCGGEFVRPEGRLRIRVVKGAVAEAFATGEFGAATMPPIGAPTPVHVGDIPVGLTLSLDLGGVIPDPCVVTISADHAGMNPAQIPCPADVNFDGVVDFNDFLEFLNYFNEGSPLADLNHDGVIDFNDLLEFLNAFNWPC